MQPGPPGWEFCTSKVVSSGQKDGVGDCLRGEENDKSLVGKMVRMAKKPPEEKMV